jgi:tetratricopeptide (TPR) repeat protein
MAIDTLEWKGTKRSLILHDSAAFLTLLAVTAVLFAVTLVLFRSFEAHRADLARRWAARGMAAYQTNQPEQAIVAYRAALSYAPAERSYELLLAESLGKAGKIEESYNYFTGLWDARPGDGFINLQLARLAAKKRDEPSAINFYRASIYGTWEGDGVERRREVRLELARYLIELHQLQTAKTELLIAGGNAPDLPEFDLTLAGLLEQAGAPQEALVFYMKTLVRQPKNEVALSRAGQLTFNMGDYAAAQRILEPASREIPLSEGNAELLRQVNRILELAPWATLPAHERVDRILKARALAKNRLMSCPDGAIPSLVSRWAGKDATTSRLDLLRDSDKQIADLQLAYDTEIETSQRCSAPAGDDALLLLLARSSASEGASHFQH